MQQRMRGPADANRLIFHWLLLAAIAALVVPIVVRVLPGVFRLQEVDLSLALRWWQVPCGVSRCKPDPLRTWRYLVVLFSTPALFALGCWFVEEHLGRGRAARPIHRGLYLGALAAQAALLIAFVWLFAEQTKLIAPGPSPNRPHAYFPMRDLYASGSLALAVLAIAARLHFGNRPRLRAGHALRRRWNQFASGNRVARALASALPYGLAVAYTAVGVVKTTASVAGTIGWHIPYFLADFTAVMNGKTLFVDFTPNYQHLSPYLLAPLFRVIGHGEGVFVATMGVISFAGLFGTFVLLRLLTKSAWLALALHVPFLAISLFTYFPLGLGNHWDVPAANTFNYYGVGPLSYLGPWATIFLAWYALRRRSSPALGALFFVAALAAINNTSYGVPALVGSIAAVLFTESRDRLIPDGRAILRIAMLLALALAAAVGLFLGLTFVRSGQLPNPELLTLFYQFAFQGWDNARHPIPGPHWLLSGFYLAAVLVAISGLSRRQDADTQRNLGMLTLTGVFGSGTLMYYIGEGYSECLVSSFSIWGLTTIFTGWTLLGPWLRRRNEFSRDELALRCIPALLLLCAYFLFALQIPGILPSRPPWKQLASWHMVHELPEIEVIELARETAAPGERVAIFDTAGKRIAVDLGLRDVLPYTPGQVFLVSQARRVLAALEDANVEKIYANHNPRELPGEIRQGMLDAGYRIVKRKTRAMLFARNPQPGTEDGVDPEMRDGEK